MRRSHFTVLTFAFVVILLVPPSAAEVQKKSSRKADNKLEAALHYDFFGVDGGRVSDQAEAKHDGTIQNGEIVQGKRKPAVKLDGRGAILVAASPADLDPAQKAFSVGASANLRHSTAHSWPWERRRTGSGSICGMASHILLCIRRVIRSPLPVIARSP